MKKSIVGVIFLVILDQVVKYIATNSLELYESVDVIKDLFSLTLFYNYGAAWGIFNDMRWFFIIVTIITLIVVGYIYKKCDESMKITKFGITLYFAGAVGNLIDRVLYGYVIDMFDIRIPIINYDFPIFNIADMCLVIGVGVIMIGMFKEEKNETRV